jgi:hypothetical protein
VKIDVAKLDSQIKKLEELRRIASDPELLALLETVMVNGSSPQGPPPQARSTIRTPPPRKKPTAKKGEFQAAVRAAIMQFDKPFSGYVVARKMENDGYEFVSSRPGIAVIEALKALVKKGVVRVYKNGVGSEPTLFERIPNPNNP